MKTICTLLAALAALSATARPTPTEDSLESQLSARLGKASSVLSVGAKPNEIVKGKVTYSGIAVEILKTDNLLQLFNPVAPPSTARGKITSCATQSLAEPPAGSSSRSGFDSVQVVANGIMVENSPDDVATALDNGPKSYMDCPRLCLA